MNYSTSARKQLTEPSEGYHLTAYPDPGTGGDPWTIGYGHTKGVKEGLHCTEEQADIWLMQDIAVAEAAVNSLVTVKMTQYQFDALVDFTFNVGSASFAHSTLLRFFNAGNTFGAAAEFARWVHGGNGTVLPGLVKRRQAESNWFTQGD